MGENTAHLSLIQLLLPIDVCLAVPQAQKGVPMPLRLAFLDKDAKRLGIVPIFQVLDDVPERWGGNILPCLVLRQELPEIFRQLLVEPLHVSSIETLPLEFIHPPGDRLQLGLLFGPFSLLTPLILATGPENGPTTVIQGINMA